MVEVIGENIDRLCSIEIRPRSGLPRGVIHRLYGRARAKQGKPLTLQAAQKLIDQIKPGEHVVFLTGAGGPPYLPKGEVDGLLGSAGLARAIDLGLKGKPIFLCEKRVIDPLTASCQAAGITIIDKKNFEAQGHRGIIEALPIDDQEAIAYAEHLLDEYSPATVISIEKLGPNVKGVIHSALGTDVTAMHGKAHHIVEDAYRRHILTIGMGDAGNEIGFGLIEEDVRKIVPYGDSCNCPCQRGIANTTKVDVLIVAGVSNWGAYGVEACMAVLLSEPKVLHNAEMQRRMHEDCIRAGAADGVYASQILYDDGISALTHQSLINILHMMVENGLKVVERHF